MSIEWVFSGLGSGISVVYSFLGDFGIELDYRVFVLIFIRISRVGSEELVVFIVLVVLEG